MPSRFEKLRMVLGRVEARNWGECRGYTLLRGEVICS